MRGFHSFTVFLAYIWWMISVGTLKKEVAAPQQGSSDSIDYGGLEVAVAAIVEQWESQVTEGEEQLAALTAAIAAELLSMRVEFIRMSTDWQAVKA